MARSSATWKPGIASPNPSGKMTLGERVAARTIAEAYRALVPIEDVGRALLAIFSGVDPFAKPADNPDGVPTPGPVPIDWQHRMAAIKLWHEYAHGKPLQGVVVDAMVRQETRVIEERTHVVELRELAQRDPRAREALRTIARAVLTPEPVKPPAHFPAARPMAPMIDATAIELDEDLDETEDLEGSADPHDPMLPEAAPEVKQESKESARSPGMVI